MRTHPDVLLRPYEWRYDAACRDHDPELWLTKPAGSYWGCEWQATVVRVCQGCPVRRECLEDALAAEGRDQTRWGIFGGLTPQQRRQLAAARDLPARVTERRPNQAKEAV